MMTLGRKSDVAGRSLSVVAALLLMPVAPALAAQAHPGSANQAAKSRPGEAAKAFLGTWRATFKGTTYMTLSLKAAGEALSGTLSHAVVSLDRDGNVSDVQPQPGSKPVTIVKVAGDTLYFNSTTQQPVQFELKLKDKAHAELSILNASPTGAVVPKPIVMVREEEKP